MLIVFISYRIFLICSTSYWLQLFCVQKQLFVILVILQIWIMFFFFFLTWNVKHRGKYYFNFAKCLIAAERDSNTSNIIAGSLIKRRLKENVMWLLVRFALYLHQNKPAPCTSPQTPFQVKICAFYLYNLCCPTWALYQIASPLTTVGSPPKRESLFPVVLSCQLAYLSVCGKALFAHPRAVS